MKICEKNHKECEKIHKPQCEKFHKDCELFHNACKEFHKWISFTNVTDNVTMWKNSQRLWKFHKCNW